MGFGFPNSDHAGKLDRWSQPFEHRHRPNYQCWQFRGYGQFHLQCSEYPYQRYLLHSGHSFSFGNRDNHRQQLVFRPVFQASPIWLSRQRRALDTDGCRVLVANGNVSRGIPKRRNRTVLLGLTIGLMVMAASCGEGDASSSGSSNETPITSITGAVTVTATSGVEKHTATFSVTAQQ